MVNNYPSKPFRRYPGRVSSGPAHLEALRRNDIKVIAWPSHEKNLAAQKAAELGIPKSYALSRICSPIQTLMWYI